MPTRLRDLNNTDFGTLNANKNKNIMRYNHSTAKFDVIPADLVLSESNNIPQTFISIVEDQIDVNNITFTGLDGGTF